MKITKKRKYLFSAVGGGGIILVIAIAVPLIINKGQKNPSAFNLQEIKNQMRIAINSKTLPNTKTAIVKMYQNGTNLTLSSQAQTAAVALAQYIYTNKETKVFTFQLGQDQKGNQLLLLTISSQKPNETNSNNKSTHQLKWVRDALAKVEFGILFQIYQKRLSSQQTLGGIKTANREIKATDFQREKTPQEKLQAKINQVILNLTSKQLNIRGDSTRKPSKVGTTSTQVVLAIQKIITSNADINNAATKLIKENDIKIKENDVTGTITITISNHGNNKMIAITGFKATGTALQIAQAKIDNVKNGATPPTKKNHVNFGSTPLAKDVNVPSKDGITLSFKVATTVNNDGKATFTYEVDANPQVDGTTTKEVSFVVSGFQTQAKVNARLTQKAIQKLVATNFTTGINKIKIASVGNPSKANVIIDIKKRISNTNAQALVLPSDIIITTDNIAKTVIIVINNHGPSKTIIISGFVSIEDALDQLLAAIPDSGGPLIIPEGITSSQFDTYVIGMGVVADGKKNTFGHKENVVPLISDTSPITILQKKYQTKITSITFPNSFITIHNWFGGFEKLTTLTLGEKLQTIENNAFYYAELTSLIIPNSVTSIGSSAFKSSPLTSLKLGNKLQTIGSEAFKHAQLTLLTIPNSVTAIGISTFYNSRLTSLTIPNTVTSIGDHAFRNSPLVSLTLGNKLQTINNGVFNNAKLTLLTIPNSVTSIGSYAFKNAQLTSLTIPNSVTAIGDHAFFNSPLTLLELGNKLQTIDYNAFFNAQLTSLTIPNSVTAIGVEAFRNSPLTTLTLGNKLQTIDDYAFFNAQLTSLIIPNSVTTIFVGAFRNSPLTTLTLGNKLKEIYMEAFFNAKLTSLTIPNSITRIGEMAFRNSPIPTITIFSNVGAHDAFKSSTTISWIKRPT